jgi:hypothetical protein
MTNEPELDDALARLATADLSPFQARAIGIAAERRLAAAPRTSGIARLEVPVLVVLSVAHLVWAIGRVFLAS